MSVTDLAFKLFAIDEASPVFKRVAAAAEASGAAVDRTSARHAAAGAAIKKFANVGSAAAILVGASAVKMAADFQQGLTTLVTGAGESEKNLKMVGNGIKGIARDTGTSTKELIAGMFMIESAGFHGKAGLDVLRAAAMGAKVGNASLGEVSNATTTIMKDFAKQNINASQAVNALVGTTKQGKVHMGDLAQSIATVAPIASATHIKLGELMGAMAELTSRGLPAAKAATALKTTIANLAGPSGAATKVMASLGLKASDVSKTLGTKGLAATFKLLTDAMKRHHIPQTEQVGMLAKMTGGNRSLAAALILSGDGAKGFADKTKKLTASIAGGKKGIDGWGKVQKDFNFKLDKFKATVEVLMISLGQHLLPIFSKLLTIITPLAPELFLLVTAFLALAVVLKVVTTIQKFVALIKELQLVTKVMTAIQWLWNIALLANPVTLIAAGIAILIAAIVFLALKTRFFQTVWSAVWTAVKAVGLAVWGFIKIVFRLWLDGLKFEFKIALDVMKLVWTIAWRGILLVGRLIWGILKIAFRVWLSGLKLEFHIAMIVMQTVWRLAWNTIKVIGQTIWRIIRILFNTFMGVMKGIMKVVMGVMTGNWSKAWSGIRQIGRSIWDGIRKLFGAFFNGMKSILGGALRIIASGWSKSWGAIRNTAKRIWDDIRSIGGRVFRGLASDLSRIWGTIARGAATAWNHVRDVIKVPVRFVINTVFGGLAKVWNAIVGKVGLGALHITPPHVGFKDGGYVNFARGGAVQGPGGPRDDKIPAYLSNGEYVVPADVVSKVGAGFFDSMRKNGGPMATEKMPFNGGGGAGGIPGFFGIPNPINVGKKIVKGVIGAGKKVLGFADKIKDFVLGLLEKKVIDALVLGPVKSALGHIPGGGVVGKVLSAAVLKLVNGMIDKLMKKNQDAFGNFKGGKIPAGQHRAVIEAGMKAAGVPPPGSVAQWLVGLNTLITRESGWNAGIVNHSDSNAAAGHPSGGLMQTISSTFNAYVPGALRHLGMFNPIANIAAGIRYIVARYGNITRVQQANPSLPPKGYMLGGLTGRGWKIMGERGPEMVWSPGHDRVLSNKRTKDLFARGHMGSSSDHLGTIEVIIKSEDGKTIERKLVKLKQARGGRRMGWEERTK